MKSKNLLAAIAALSLFIGVMNASVNAQIRTYTNISDRVSAGTPENIRLQQHLQGQFERLTSDLGLNKRSSVEVQFQVDAKRCPVNIFILSATVDPALANAAYASIKAKSTFPEPLQAYKITFNYAPSAPVSTEPVTAQVKSSKPCRTFTINNESLMGDRPVAQAHSNPPQASSSTSTSATTSSTQKNSTQAKPAPSPAKLAGATPPSTSAPKAAMAASQAPPSAAGNPATDINAYYAELIRNIKKKWTPSAEAREKTVAVQFTIGSDGSLKNADVTRSSGNEQTDQAALKAVQSCAPFRHLPTDCPLSEIQGQFTFGKNGMIK